jgi:hypothetical protein
LTWISGAPFTTHSLLHCAQALTCVAPLKGVIFHPKRTSQTVTNCGSCDPERSRNLGMIDVHRPQGFRFPIHDLIMFHHQ